MAALADERAEGEGERSEKDAGSGMSIELDVSYACVGAAAAGEM